ARAERVADARAGAACERASHGLRSREGGRSGRSRGQSAWRSPTWLMPTVDGLPTMLAQSAPPFRGIVQHFNGPTFAINGGDSRVGGGHRLGLPSPHPLSPPLTHDSPGPSLRHA